MSTKKGVGESFVPSSGRVDAPVKSIGRPEVGTKADFHADYQPVRVPFPTVINEPIPEIKQPAIKVTAWQDFARKRKCRCFKVKNYPRNVSL